MRTRKTWKELHIRWAKRYIYNDHMYSKTSSNYVIFRDALCFWTKQLADYMKLFNCFVTFRSQVSELHPM